MKKEIRKAKNAKLQNIYKMQKGIESSAYKKCKEDKECKEIEKCKKIKNAQTAKSAKNAKNAKKQNI